MWVGIIYWMFIFFLILYFVYELFKIIRDVVWEIKHTILLKKKIQEWKDKYTFKGENK